jgi:hypothetical protein
MVRRRTGKQKTTQRRKPVVVGIIVVGGGVADIVGQSAGRPVGRSLLPHSPMVMVKLGRFSMGWSAPLLLPLLVLENDKGANSVKSCALTRS